MLKRTILDMVNDIFLSCAIRVSRIAKRIAKTRINTRYAALRRIDTGTSGHSMKILLVWPRVFWDVIFQNHNFGFVLAPIDATHCDAFGNQRFEV